MNDFPTIEVKDIEDLHFGVMPHLVIDFGDDVGQIATSPRFEAPMRDLIQRLRGAEEVLRQIQYAKIAGITGDMELATAQNCERCNLRCLTLTKIAGKWLCGHCCFIDGFNSAKRGEPAWWRNDHPVDEDGVAMDLACGDPDCCGWTPRPDCTNCSGTGTDPTGRVCARCDGEGKTVEW